MYNIYIRMSNKSTRYLGYVGTYFEGDLYELFKENRQIYILYAQSTKRKRSIVQDSKVH